jgi:hypothetical protein
LPARSCPCVRLKKFIRLKFSVGLGPAADRPQLLDWAGNRPRISATGRSCRCQVAAWGKLGRKTGWRAFCSGDRRRLVRRCYRCQISQSCTGRDSSITEPSGKSEWVHVRWACPRFLRQTFHVWAAHSIGFCDWARAYYRQQRDRGKDHHAAVRALTFKWIRIAFRYWKDGVLYNDARYIQSLRRRASPLTAIIDKSVLP